MMFETIITLRSRAFRAEVHLEDEREAEGARKLAVAILRSSGDRVKGELAVRSGNYTKVMAQPTTQTMEEFMDSLKVKRR